MPDIRKKITTKIQRAQINLTPKKDSPDELLGELLQDVQLRRVFPDSITFVDMMPTHTLRRILKTYKKHRLDPGFSLHDFVQQHFSDLLNTSEEVYTTNPSHTVEQHIEELWGVLRREVTKDSGSLVGLPYPYVVAGGRYIAQFYWDTYFVMLGLAAGGHWDMVENMIRNCAFMIRKYGYVPNGNRTYYTRSQPPVFALMVRLLAEHKGKTTYVRYLPYLLAEHAFWMRGGNRLNEKRTATRHAVRMPNGTVLNRYFDAKSTPRPEGYKEDVEIALLAPDRVPSKVYLDLRAGAESGWDYSSRWLADPTQLASIHTTDIIPVDLNCLVLTLEETIAETYGILKQRRAANRYKGLAEARKEAIREYCWNEEKGYYYDYDFVKGEQTPITAASSLFALFTGVATKDQASEMAVMVRDKFIQPGGLVTTLHETGQQWDWPNGWAPLQWVAIKGLRNYGHKYLAEEIKKRWIDTCMHIYKDQGKLVEKYNVVFPDRGPTNGEYVLQDGFGWTNGVLLALLKEEE